jgi:hypothetical protein
MAQFCTSCGSPLGDGQAFCTKCGAKLGAPQPAATPPAQAAPVAASAPASAPSAAPAAAGGGSAFVKILLIAVAVIFLFGAIGVGAVMYIGYRVRQKAREMGLTSAMEHARHASALRGVDGCQWLSKEDVSAAIGIPVVRAEMQTGDEPGCAYSVMGDVNEMTMKHATQLNKKMMSKSDQETMEKFGKVLSQGAGALSSGGSNASAYPGEAIVLTFTVNEGAAQFQMKLNKGVLGGMGPMATKDVPDLGDEAFEAAGSMLFVRKGDRALQLTYTQCPCGLDEVLPLAQKLARHL